MEAVEYLNTRGAAAFLCMGTSTLEAMRCHGIGPKYAIVAKRAVRYKKSDLVEWMETFFREGNDKECPAKSHQNRNAAV